MPTAYECSLIYSECKLKKLRSRLKEFQLGDDIVMVCGSYARREASEYSDSDFYIVSDNPDKDPSLIQSVKSEVKEVLPNGPSENGAFGDIVNKEEMLQNIGGQGDTNENLTRRVLLLLEGEWLFNEQGLQDLRREILERYIRKEMTDHQLALFLLNDIIRYYRTVAVDYEFKTFESNNPKPWGIRNIKLVFSRKLLYASGLFSVAITADREREKKISILEDLFKLPVMERMKSICGTSKMEPVLESYNFFLEKLEDPQVRGFLMELKNEKRDDPCFRKKRDDPRFRELKNEGHRFTRELLKLFESTFDSTHPIRRAILF